MDKTHSIKLADGTFLENLGLNGNNYISAAKVDESTFKDNCSPVIFGDGSGEFDLHENMELIHILEVDGEWWIALRDITAPELESRQLRADIDAYARVSGILFVLEAESDEPHFDETTMLENADIFNEWSNYWTGKRRQIIQYDGLLYRAIHDVLDPSQNRNPKTDTTNQLWKKIGQPGEKWPEWSQPIAGVDIPYMKGDKVTHNGSRWVSDVDNNVWAPGAYGWTQRT
jgi:hypothetical protein